MKIEFNTSKKNFENKLKNKENEVKELKLAFDKKDIEIQDLKKMLDIKKDEIKQKEKYSLLLEKNLDEIKSKHLKEIEKLDNERNTLENHYIKIIKELEF